MKKIIIFLSLIQSTFSFAQTVDCDSIILKSGIVRHQKIIDINGSRITTYDCNDEEKKYMLELESIDEIRFSDASDRFSKKVLSKLKNTKFEKPTKQKEEKQIPDFISKSDRKVEKKLPDNIPEWAPKNEIETTTNLTVGTGFPDFINIGFRVKMNQIQHGFEVAFFKVPSFTNYSDDNFWDESGSLLSYNLYLSHGNYWYSKFGAGYAAYKTMDSQFALLTEKNVTRINLAAGFGRAFKFSSRHSIGIDTGLLFPIYKKSELNSQSFSQTDIRFLFLIPLVDLNLFWSYNF